MTTQEELEQQVIQQEFEALLDDYRHTAHRRIELPYGALVKVKFITAL